MSELETNYEEFKAAMEQFNGPFHLFIDRGISVFHSRRNEPVKPMWRVSVMKDYYSTGAEHTVFAEALAELIKKMRENTSKCTICGGRMDGACKHVHGDEKDGGK